MAWWRGDALVLARRAAPQERWQLQQCLGVRLGGCATVGTVSYRHSVSCIHTHSNHGVSAARDSLIRCADAGGHAPKSGRLSDAAPVGPRLHSEAAATGVSARHRKAARQVWPPKEPTWRVGGTPRPRWTRYRPSARVGVVPTVPCRLIVAVVALVARGTGCGCW